MGPRPGRVRVGGQDGHTESKHTNGVLSPEVIHTPLRTPQSEAIPNNWHIQHGPCSGRPGLVMDTTRDMVLVCEFSPRHPRHPLETSPHPRLPRMPEESQAACTCVGVASCTGTRLRHDFQVLGTDPPPPVSTTVIERIFRI